MNHNLCLSEAVKYGENNQDYISIISGEKDEVKTNKYIFSLFSLGLSPALSNTCVSPTLLFPDCSTLSLQHLINIITTGYTVTEGMSSEELNEIIEAAQLLSVDMKDYKHGGSKLRKEQHVDEQ